MNEELKNLLEENLEISRESLKILKKMRRAQTIDRWFKILYWAIIAGGLIGAYYYLQPIAVSMLDTWQKIMGDISAIGNAGKSLNPNNISPDILDKIQGFLKN